MGTVHTLPTAVVRDVEMYVRVDVICRSCGFDEVFGEHDVALEALLDHRCPTNAQRPGDGTPGPPNTLTTPTTATAKKRRPSW